MCGNRPRGVALPGTILLSVLILKLQLNADIVQFGIKVQRVHAAFTPDARKAHAAKGRAQVAQKPTIDPGNSGSELLGDSMAALEVTCPDGRRQSIICVVRECNGLVFGIERSDVANRTENFFLHATSRFGEARENCRLDIKTIGAGIPESRNSSTCNNCGSFLSCQLIITENLLAMGLGD